MKFVIQRVTSASCCVDEQITGQINRGFLVFIGVSDEDTTEIADKMTKNCLVCVYLRTKMVKQIWH